MRKPFLLVTAVVALAPTSRPAEAQVVDRSLDDGVTNGFFISDVNHVANTFFLSSPSSFNSVRFWGIEEGGWAGGFVDWSVFSTADPMVFNPRPETTVASGSSALTRTALGTAGGLTSSVFDFSFGTLGLDTGLFWLALNVQSSGSGTLRWDQSEIYGDQHLVQSTTGDYSSSTVLHMTSARFQLHDTPSTVTPEPASIILLGSGLAGLGFVRRRRRRDLDSSAD